MPSLSGSSRAFILHCPYSKYDCVPDKRKSNLLLAENGKLGPAQSTCVLRDWALHLPGGVLLPHSSRCKQLHPPKCCFPSIAPKRAVPLLNCVGFDNNTVLVSFLPGCDCVKITSEQKCHRPWVNIITAHSSRDMFGHIHLRAVVGNFTNVGILLWYALRIAF